MMAPLCTLPFINSSAAARAFLFASTTAASTSGVAPLPTTFETKLSSQSNPGNTLFSTAAPRTAASTFKQYSSWADVTLDTINEPLYRASTPLGGRASMGSRPIAAILSRKAFRLPSKMPFPIRVALPISSTCSAMTAETLPRNNFEKAAPNKALPTMLSCTMVASFASTWNHSSPTFIEMSSSTMFSSKTNFAPDLVPSHQTDGDKPLVLEESHER
mmetsp:Transcript_2722/g.9176  ORF Transcript_2722/g.9176 Transcript_2722/m.9176 type:complete len:217 (+) Transcript_2722:811-1461(+)